MKRFSTLLLLAATLCVSVYAQKGNLQKGGYGYLYCHMNDHGRAWTAYALSRDGFHYEDLLEETLSSAMPSMPVSKVPHVMPISVVSMTGRAI